MPKRINEKDKIQICFAYYLGATSSGKPVYAPINTCYAQVSQIDGRSSRMQYGLDFNYNALAYVVADEYTRKIDESTKLWVYKDPPSVDSQGDYSIVRVGREIDGLIPIYAISLTGNVDRLWYVPDGTNKILSTDVIYVLDNKTAYVPRNMYFPVNTNTFVWERKPSDLSDITGRIVLLSKSTNENMTIMRFGAFNGT